MEPRRFGESLPYTAAWVSLLAPPSICCQNLRNGKFLGWLAWDKTERCLTKNPLPTATAKTIKNPLYNRGFFMRLSQYNLELKKKLFSLEPHQSQATSSWSDNVIIFSRSPAFLNGWYCSSFSHITLTSRSVQKTIFPPSVSKAALLMLPAIGTISGSPAF